MITKSNDLSIVEFSERLLRHQQVSDAFFDSDLLNLCADQFSLYKSLCVVRDDNLNFTSWIDQEREITDVSSHPYMEFSKYDPNANFINSMCKDGSSRRLFRSSEIISSERYDEDYADWLIRNLNCRYSLVMPFDIGKYHLCFYKRKDDPDFSDREMDFYDLVARTISVHYDQFLDRRRLSLLTYAQQTALDSMGIGYVIMDSDFRVLGYNSEAGSAFKVFRLEKELASGQLGFLRFLYNRTEGTWSSKSFTASGYRLCLLKSGIRDQSFFILLSAREEKSLPEDHDGISVWSVLSTRELEVTDLLASGNTYYEIADTLSISYNTVKNHIQNIYQKCHVRNQAQLISRYVTEKIFRKLSMQNNEKQ